MKKNLLLTTLLLATTLTFTACGKTEEAPVEESTVAMEETVVEEETETETVVEEESTAEETLSMTEEEIVAFLEEVRDMDYESYTYRSAHYYTDCKDAEGNPEDDRISDDDYFHVDSNGNIFLEEINLTEGVNEDEDIYDLIDDTHVKYYFLADNTIATNDLNISETVNWDAFREGTKDNCLNYAKFFDGYPDFTLEELASRAVVTEYNKRPALYIENITGDTEVSFLECLYSDAETLTATEGSLVYDVYLYLDTPGEYTSAESAEFTFPDGKVCTVHDVYELSKVNSTELPEIPENFIKY